jgi:hypothetical protein
MPSFRSDENARSEPFKGGCYSIADRDVLGVAKVLKLEPDRVHFRIYKQRFHRLPCNDPTLLTLGRIDDEHRFGMGHLPLPLKTLKKRDPLLMTYSEVETRQLEEYELSKGNNRGAVWE